MVVALHLVFAQQFCFLEMFIYFSFQDSNLERIMSKTMGRNRDMIRVWIRKKGKGKGEG